MKWYVIQKNERIGPFSAQEIRQQLHAGTVTLDTFVVREGSPLRRKISDVIEIINPPKESKKEERSEGGGFGLPMGQTVLSSTDSPSLDMHPTVIGNPDQPPLSSLSKPSASTPGGVSGVSQGFPSKAQRQEPKSSEYQKSPSVGPHSRISMGNNALATFSEEPARKPAALAREEEPPVRPPLSKPPILYPELLGGAGHSVPPNAVAPHPQNSLQSSSLGESQVRFINPAKKTHHTGEGESSKVIKPINKQKVTPEFEDSKPPFSKNLSSNVIPQPIQGRGREGSNAVPRTDDIGRERVKKPRRHKVLSIAPGIPMHQQPHIRSEADFNSIHSGKMNWEKGRINPSFQKSNAKAGRFNRRKKFKKNMAVGPVLPALITACLLVLVISVVLFMERSNLSKRQRTSKPKPTSEHSEKNTLSAVEQEEALIAETIREQKKAPTRSDSPDASSVKASQAPHRPEPEISQSFPAGWPAVAQVTRLADLQQAKFKTVVIDHISVDSIPSECRPCQVNGTLSDGTAVLLVTNFVNPWIPLKPQFTGKIAVKAFVQSKPNEWRLVVQEMVNR